MSSAARHYRHWTQDFLGVGYARGGEGPTAYDCWHYWRWVQRERYGREVPAYATPPSIGSIAKAMPAWAAEFGWRPVSKPDDGDAAFLCTFKMPTHIGVWVDDLKSVLHCPEGGAVLHDGFHLKVAGWTLRGFFRPVN